jgi:enoyl-CoA hydratase/carnithine racemase
MTPEYFSQYDNFFALDRTVSGVVTLRFHTDGGPVTFTGPMHAALPRVLDDIAMDRGNQVLIITGTGDRFMSDIDGPSLGDITRPAVWDAIIAEGRRVVQRLADLEMPIVAAVNGPATVHSEYALLADIVIASEMTVFGDFPHLTFGLVPGDGIHVIWEEVLGLNRSRHLILTQGTFTAAQALGWGAIAEVVEQENVLPRALEIAEGLASRPQLLNRYLAMTIRQRLSRRMAEGTVLGMALEAITGANMPYLDQG